MKNKSSINVILFMFLGVLSSCTCNVKILQNPIHSTEKVDHEEITTPLIPNVLSTKSEV